MDFSHLDNVAMLITSNLDNVATLITSNLDNVAVSPNSEMGSTNITMILNMYTRIY